MISHYMSKWSVDLLIIVLLVGYLVIGWQWLKSSQPIYEPGQGKEEHIVNTTIHVGEPFELFIKVSVDQSQCQVVSERHIVDDNGHDVYSKWVQIPQSALEKLKETHIILKVDLPKLNPGTYFYISNVHLSCPEGTSYLRTTAFLPFKIIP